MSKHHSSSNISRVQVNLFGQDVHIETTMIYLEIFNVTETDFNSSYTLKVDNNFGNENCFTQLEEGSMLGFLTLFIKRYVIWRFLNIDNDNLFLNRPN